MTHRIATTFLALLSLLALVVALTAGTGAELAPYALASSSTTAVCTSDADCAARDAQHNAFTAPESDAAGEPSCSAGSELFDTENPDEGDEGIVCRPMPLVQL